MSASLTNLRELEEIKKPLELFKHLKTDLDKLKSQVSNLSKVNLASKLLKGINLKKSSGWMEKYSCTTTWRTYSIIWR